MLIIMNNILAINYCVDTKPMDSQGPAEVETTTNNIAPYLFVN